MLLLLSIKLNLKHLIRLLIFPRNHPKQPSKAIKSKARELLEDVNLESSEDENKAAYVSKLVAQLVKNQHKKSRKTETLLLLHLRFRL